MIVTLERAGWSHTTQRRGVPGVLFFRTLRIWLGKRRNLSAHRFVKRHEVAVFAGLVDWFALINPPTGAVSTLHLFAPIFAHHAAMPLLAVWCHKLSCRRLRACVCPVPSLINTAMMANAWISKRYN
jgi:hypothetical protein